MRVLMPALGHIRYNNHLHQGFLIDTFLRHGYDLVLYGPDVQHRRKGRVPVLWDPKRPFQRVVRTVRPDLIFWCYPRAKWLKRDWADLGDIPKVVYHSDFHYERHLRMFRGADLVLLRAKTAAQDAERMKGRGGLGDVRWLPFSVDMPIVDSAPGVSARVPKVHFSGATQGEPYPARSAALTALRRTGLLGDEYKHGYHSQVLYYKALKRHMFALACTSAWDLTIAKHVEMLAAGCILLTDGGTGIDDLTGGNYFVYDHGQSAPDLVLRILRDPGLRRDAIAIASRGAEFVRKNHSHLVRGRQLCAQMEALL
jgi:hypothetical protein